MKCSLLALPPSKSRAVTLGEQREPEGDREERHGDYRGPGGTAQSERGEAERERGPDARRNRAREPGKDAGDDDRGHEHDEPRQDEEHQRRAFGARQTLVVERTAQERYGDDRHGNHGNDLRCSGTGAVAPTNADRESDQGGRDECERERGRETAGRDDATQEDRGRRRLGKLRDDDAHGGADSPADQHADNGGEPTLDDGQEPQLPAPCPVPREADPCISEITAHSACSEESECEQQRRRLATYEQETARADVRTRFGVA